MFNPLNDKEVAVLIVVLVAVIFAILVGFLCKLWIKMKVLGNPALSQRGSAGQFQGTSSHGRLRKCRDCGKEVSVMASKCPNCGTIYPAMTLTAYVIIILISLGIGISVWHTL